MPPASTVTAHTGLRPGRIARRLLVLVLAVAALVAVAAAPAFAHAGLVSTDPAAGAVLTESPKYVEMQFTEPVTVALGGVRVFDQKGNRIDTDPPVKPAANAVRVGIRPTLGDGSYIVTWRVTSADTHPVQGAFTFQVGTSANATSRQVTGLADRLLAGQKGAEGVGGAWGVTRWLAFAGIALLVGAVGFCVLVWRDARDFRTTRRIVTGAWMLLFVATVIGFVLQGPYQSGQGLGHVVDPKLWRDVADSRFGLVWLGRLGLLVIAFVLLRWMFRHRPAAEYPLPRWWLVLATLVGLGIVFMPGFAGHSATGDVVGLALVSDGVHVAAMAVWLGGLVVLAAVALRGDDIDGRRPVVERFSRLAAWCVVALLATGAFQTWRDVRALGALRNTDFGRILVIKLVVFAVMAVFAVFSREILQRLFWSGPEHTDQHGMAVVSGAAVDDDLDVEVLPHELEAERRAEWRNLRRSVWAEVVLGLGVLAVTAVLVNATPAVNANAAASNGPAGVTLRSPKVVVDITVAPAVAGANDVHVSTFTAAGAPLDVADLAITFDLPSGGRTIAPITLPLRKLGPGHYLSPGFDIPLAGDWRVTAKARLTDIDEVTQTGTIPIR